MNIVIALWNFKRYFTVELRKELNRVDYSNHHYLSEEIVSIVLNALENTFNRIIVDGEPFPIPAVSNWNTHEKKSLIKINKDEDEVSLITGVDNESSSMR